MEPGSSGEYNRMLKQYSGSPQFSELVGDRAKADGLIEFRDLYKSSRELDDEDSRIIDNYTKARADYSKKGRFTPSYEDLVGLGVAMPDVSSLPTEQALQALSSSKEQMQTKVNTTFDKIYLKDFKYGIETIFNEKEREARGRETSKSADLTYRAAQAGTTRLLKTIGHDETVEHFSVKHFPENPKFDRDLSSRMATAGGDVLVAMSAFIAIIYCLIIRHRTRKSMLRAKQCAYQNLN